MTSLIDHLANFFIITYFLGEISKFSAEISHRVSNTHRFNEKREISLIFFF